MSFWLNLARNCLTYQKSFWLNLVRKEQGQTVSLNKSLIYQEYQKT